MCSNTIKYFIFTFLFLCSFSISSGEVKDEPSATSVAKTVSSKKIIIDSSTILVRKLDEAKQQELLKDDIYKYDRKGPAPKTWWDRFWEWFWRMIGDLFNESENNKSNDVLWGLSYGKLLIYILTIAVTILLIYLIVKNDIRALFYGKSASVKIDFTELEDDIHKINFDELIATALAKKDFRKAIRLHFLKLLKELTDNNLINWKIDKTNNDYQIELANSKYSSKFKELAVTYEYVWYGDFHLDEPNFKSTVSKFQSFKI